MENNQQHFVYQGSLTDVERGRKNRSFQSATLRLMAVDVIANKTRYTKETILKALPTLCNIPLVGRWKGRDFGSHESQLELNEEEGYQMVYNTTPLGVIPESANFWFETVEVDGKEQEFLCVDVVLWKRQKEVKSLIKRKQFSISMEVTITDADKDLTGVLEIRDFYFTAVCVLGSNVPPAFAGAMIQTYSADHTQEQINQMMLEFAKELGGEKMATEPKQVATEEEEKKDSVKTEETTTTSEETTPENESSTSESDQEPKEENEPETEEEEDKAFACQPKDQEDDEYADQPADEEKDKADEIDPKETPVKEEDSKDEDEEDEQPSDYDRLKVDYQNVVDALMIKTRAYEELESSHQALQQEITALRSFKEEVMIERRRVVEVELFERFVSLAEMEEYQTLKETASEHSIDELETQLYALAGRKFYQEQKPATTTSHVAYEVNYQSTQAVDSVFNLLDTYLKK